MQRSKLEVIGDDRCDFLRWKGLYIEATEDPSASYSTDGSFWCLHTYNCLGPDGKPVNDYECNPSRACYRPL